MALLGASRRDRAAPSPAVIGSRLLPDVLDAGRLEKLGTLNILDFGRANSGSLEYFNQFPCRLSVLDTAESLLGWSASVAERASGEEPPSQQQLQHELAGVLQGMEGHRYDLVFLWDTLNHLHPLGLPAFSRLLRRHVSSHTRGHGFMLHKRDAEQRLRSMGLGGIGEVRLLAESDAALYPHTRKTINEALGDELRIQHAVLHGDGRLEFLLSASAGSRRQG